MSNHRLRTYWSFTAKLQRLGGIKIIFFGYQNVQLVHQYELNSKMLIDRRRRWINQKKEIPGLFFKSKGYYELTILVRKYNFDPLDYG